MAALSGPFIAGQWRNLAAVTFEIDPAALRERAPPGLVLDLWRGRCLVSVVGLLFRDTRILGIPLPFGGSHPQVNIRFYVRRPDVEDSQPGVVFLRQMVPGRLVAWGTRRLYHEPAVAAPIRWETTGRHGGHPHLNHPPRREGEFTEKPEAVAYSWGAGEGIGRLEVGDLGETAYPEPGSAAAFVAERYWGYNLQPHGSALQFRVERPRWMICPAGSAQVEGDWLATAGLDSRFAGKGGELEVVSAFWADGSTTAIYRGRRIR